MRRHGVIIVGGSGYGAGELLRLLAGHPAIEVCGVVSRTHAARPVSSVHTHLTGISDIFFSAEPDLQRLGDFDGKAVILAMPSGHAAEAVSRIVDLGLTPDAVVIDLSGDLRLTDRATHEKFYPGVPFATEIRQTFRYGLPELFQGEGGRVANPGCLATAAIMALAPFRGGVLQGRVIIDAKTGTSGAGREPQASMHHPSRAGDFTAYKVLEHRHEPEILQALGEEFQRTHPVVFAPHLIPVSRGIFVTVYAELAREASLGEVEARVRDTYRGSNFVRLRSTPPRLSDVVGTNFCDIGIAVRGIELVVMCAIDNLGKGMAGQAVQNLNRAFGLPEETGLLSGALGPV